MSARPLKKGLDYFPLDVDMADDTAVCVIEGKHGLAGFAIIVKLFMRIYREGYYLKWDENEPFVFARKSGADHSLVEAVVADALALGLFDRAMHETHGILTSHGIQNRYVNAVGRRVNGSIRAEFLLLDTETIVSADINGGFPPAESTQTKQNESKQKKSREDKPLSSSVDDTVLTYWRSKAGRPATNADLHSLQVLCKNHGNAAVEVAIGQAVVQGERPDNYALITTIAKEWC